VFRKGLLSLHESRGCGRRFGKDHEELVAAVVDDLAAGALDGLAEEPSMVGQNDRPGVAELADELRRALDVSEDECDFSIG
jgi:hypothetical protein